MTLESCSRFKERSREIPGSTCSKGKSFFIEPDKIIMMQPGLHMVIFPILEDPFPPTTSIREQWISNVGEEFSFRKIRVDLDGRCSCGDKKYAFGVLIYPGKKEPFFVLSEIKEQ